MLLCLDMRKVPIDQVEENIRAQITFPFCLVGALVTLCRSRQTAETFSQSVKSRSPRRTKIVERDGGSWSSVSQKVLNGESSTEMNPTEGIKPRSAESLQDIMRERPGAQELRLWPLSRG